MTPADSTTRPRVEGEREQEILDLMAEGLSTEAIAGKLFVAQVTVRTHISTILKKLRVPDRAAAVRLVAEGSGA